MTTTPTLAAPRLRRGLLLGGLALLAGCQAARPLTQAPLPPGAAASVPAPVAAASQLVTIRGRVSAGDTTSVIAGVELVFSGRDDQAAAVSYRASTQAAGTYQVAVLAGRTYQVAVNKDGKNIETQEFVVPTATPGGQPITKNFYIGYAESDLASGPGDVSALPGAKTPRLMPDLEWPLPAPSARWSFPATFLAGARTYGQADQRLTRLLAPAGYDTYAYYAIPGGFALVTQLEHIDEQARPAAPRWSKAVTTTGFFQRLSEVITPRQGRFRVLVFAFTPDPVTFNQTTAKLSKTQAESMLDKGDSAIDPYFGQLACPAGCRLTVLVYEYLQADVARPPQLVKPSLVQANVQLLNSNVKLPR